MLKMRGAGSKKSKVQTKSKSNNKDNETIYNVIFFTLIIFFILIRVLLFFTDRILWFDEPIYIGIGKWLFSSGRAGIFEALRPLLLPVMLGFLWKIHINPLIGGLILELLFGVLGLISIWFISLEFMSKKYAVLSTLFFSSSFLLLVCGTKVLTDVPALSIGLLSVLFFIRKKRAVAGLLAGLSFMTKFPYALIILSFIIFEFVDYLSRRKSLKRFIKDSLTLALSFIVVVIPYLLFNQVRYNSMLYPFKCANEVIQTCTWLYKGGPFFYILVALKENFLFLLLIAALWYFIKNIIKLGKYHKNFYGENRIVFLLLLLLLMFTVYFSTLGRKDERYFLTMLGPLSILSAYGFYCLETSITKLLKRDILKKIKILTFIVIVVFFSMSFYKQIDYLIDSSKGYYSSKGAGELLVFMSESLKDDDVILATDILPAAYFDNRIVSFSSLEYAVKILEQHSGEKGIILINTCDYPCRSEDLKCAGLKKSFLEEVNSTRKLVFRAKSGDCEYLVYKN